MIIARVAFVFLFFCELPGFSNTLFRIACGGSGGTDKTGGFWQSDTLYTGGSPFLNAGNLDVPYRNLRFAPSFTYTFPLQPGSYNVILKFVEPNKTAAGQRVFNVSINGAPVLSNVDLFAVAGTMVIKDYTLPITLLTGTGKLTIALSSVLAGGNAVLSGIQIDDFAAPVGTPMYTSGLEAQIPSQCPGALVFYVATNTNRLFWCSTLLPGSWVQVSSLGDPYNLQVIKFEKCCSGIFRLQFSAKGTPYTLVGTDMPVSFPPTPPWTDMR